MTDKTVAEQMQEVLDAWLRFEPIDVNRLVPDMRRWIKEIEEEKEARYDDGYSEGKNDEAVGYAVW